MIPARAGSKGLPDKNLMPVAGISLVGRAIRCAREFARLAGLCDMRIVVDTDGSDIADEARRWRADVPFLRPAALAADHISTVKSTLALLERLPDTADAVVLLQPTSPLRTSSDVLACWEEFDLHRSPSVVAVRPSKPPIQLSLSRDEERVLHWWSADAGERRRQEFDVTYQLTGSVYIIATDALTRHESFTIPGVSRGVRTIAEHSVDVDSAEDLALANALANARQPAPINFAGMRIGPGAPCFVIAEAGANHNGDPDLAHRLVDVAADAGADAVKFQVFRPDKLVSVTAPKADYQVANTGQEASQLEMLRALTLPDVAFRELTSHATEREILFLATAFDEESADLLEDLQVPAFKVPSGEVTNHPFLAYLARKGRPLLLSTGMSRMEEVGAAVDTIRAAGNPPLALFHCVSEYPAPPDECNLRAVETLQRAFEVPAGWSDHTDGLPLSVAAIAMGAALLEKHFTLDRRMSGPDHAASLEADELAELLRQVRVVESARGTGLKEPAACELNNTAAVRRSLHAVRTLSAGHRLERGDIEALRPGTGISPAELERIVGRDLADGVAGGTMLRWDDLE